ncbi:GGDEF domain-containing protein [Butyrivibrio sp. WCD2001]|uniref:GGDEF domain-containing protein n=1 Tax=Butyrivibrio sp. WCD2001 TaxID=1280681 RepID=UPI000426BB95|nr:GGDEF domain-containing protein [Butyrivibrio sp. WCD2001]
MRVGLLISEFKDNNTCDICLGADAAARDLGVELVIFPGKVMITDKNYSEERAYDYQYQAVYDYIYEAGFDGLIVDIEHIGNKAPILKKEAFLKQFGKKPLLNLSNMEGFECVSYAKDTDSYEKGFLAIEQIIRKISGNEVKAKRQKISSISKESIINIIGKTARFSEIASQANYSKENYDESVKKMEKCFDNIEVFFLENPQICSLKKGWNVPKHCKRIIIIKDGKAGKKEKIKDMETSDIFDLSEIKGTKVIRNIFRKDKQYGFFIMGFDDSFRIENYDDLITGIILSSIRINFLKKFLYDTEKELTQCQEKLARDGSVLDHIGDEDYLTDLPNRRGFFAKAYDLLKSDFKEGTYAVVAYIDMDSLKNINTIHGHDEGDNAVKRVAEILKEVFGENSVCGRIRGDEFAVIEVTTEEDKAEELRTEMARQNNKLLMDNTKYLNHLIYSICEFDYEESLSLREMLKETDDNLKNMRRMETIGK